MSEPQPLPPSAQVVAQEFVKQYYTMLHTAPDFLHRFYSHNSSFIHGEDQVAVTGQSEIHKKIASLNFNNCHARICQVDSQSSVAGSIVVQVIGELSNSAQPMRRFVQSFVLAPQAANKYYVHVDIFRYQDDYASIEDGYDVEDAVVKTLENGETVELVANGIKSLTMAVQQENNCETVTAEENVDGGCETSDVTLALEESSFTTENTADVKVMRLEKPTSSTESEAKRSSETAPMSAVVNEKLPAVTEPEKVCDEPAPVVQAAAPAKPLTWAALASRNAGGPSQSTGSAANVAPLARPPATVTNTAAPVRAPAVVSDQKPEQLPMPPRTARSAAPPQDERNGGSNGRVAVNGSKDAENGAKRGPSSVPATLYNDNQQVFVGNLPQQLNDQELIEFFEQYGAVLDFRINRKTGGSQAGNNVGQKNFGFMAFESPETVEKVLAARPIYMGKHRLNIEEKKPKEELAATRTRTPRFPPATNNRQESGSGLNRLATNGSGPRRGRDFRNDARSTSGEGVRTNQTA